MYDRMNNTGSVMPASHEQAIFTLAVAKPPAERAAFLQRECAGDAALRARLEALLAAHEQPNPLLATVSEANQPTVKAELAEDPLAEDVGQTIGRYKLLEKVGEGGCGVVYVAEQTEPVRRRVALKVIKLGMDTKAVVARFEAERQALALMDHPNIAKVLDAGATEGRLSSRPQDGDTDGAAPIVAGRPYFVMELVRGIRITEYCDQNNLPTKERLDLFIKVCQAISRRSSGCPRPALSRTCVSPAMANGLLPTRLMAKCGSGEPTLGNSRGLFHRVLLSEPSTMAGLFF